MFNKLTELVGAKKQGYRPGSLLPILSAEALLADPGYQQYATQLQALTAVPDAHFAHFYWGAIQQFAAYVQVIPKAYDQPLFSLLHEGLLVALHTLDLFVQHYPQSTPLERYALFTACLLQDIACIATRYRVLITNPEGVTQWVWQAYHGPLTAQTQGDYYKLIPLSTSFERLDKGVRVLLARQVLGEAGFNWIASDLYVLMEWLAALQEGDGDEVMRLIKIIKLYRTQTQGLVDGLPMMNIEALISTATEYADQFYAWLAEGIADGTIKVNRADAEVHVTEAGVFVEKSAILKTFADLYKVPGSVVLTQLGNFFGVGKQSGHDMRYVQLFSDYPEQSVNAQRTFAGPLGRKAGMIRDGLLFNELASVLLRGGPLVVSPHVRLPAGMQASQRALADFRQDPQVSPGMKQR